MVDAQDYCALNVVLYGPTRRWTMTERRHHRIERREASFVIGPSALHWANDALTFDIDEVSCPLPLRVHGQVKFHPSVLLHQDYQLDRHGKHHWRPIAPLGRVEVTLSQPSLSWNGNAYLDTNSGSEPLESAFSSWHWSRAEVQDGSVVLYDVNHVGGTQHSLALQFDHHGQVQHLDPPSRAALRNSRWGVARETRSETANSAAVAQTLLDAPFYARSLVSAKLNGQQTTAMHESLSLDRFKTRWVQSMLRFRIPRPMG